ncbi:MAG: MATE family efflux transporter [Bacteroidaceae bacterium]|nr:MATE family efflux transporter [Bacteroidaceae bacterium]
MISQTKTSSINQEILKLAIPSILANITVPLVGMVDIAIVGHISDATSIGGIAIGTMLFDLLYWNFSFLRVGTGGLTAQAYGKGDTQAQISHLIIGIRNAIVISLIIWLLQWWFVDIVLYFVPCTKQVAEFANRYFFIRIWAAPATLSLMVLKGWYIGMQNSIIPMVCDITVNVVNMLASFILAFYTPLCIIGVAYGTVIAQYVGLIVALVPLKYVLRKSQFAHTLTCHSILTSIFALHHNATKAEQKQSTPLNLLLFIRSSCMLAIYVGFTSLTSLYGDESLAIGTIMMKLFMLFSYLIDGFAYAGEALTGRFIGAGNYQKLVQSTKALIIWTLGISLLFTILFTFGGKWMFSLMTSSIEIIEHSQPYLPWLIAMPIFGCFAFMWDGIFEGATSGKYLMLCMLYSLIGFFGCFYALKDSIGIQAIYVSYFAHLLIRALYLTFKYPTILHKV